MTLAIKNYPKKWDELPTIQREKAIEIANDMMKQGYREKDVTPIAAKKAKQWYRMLSVEEREALENKEYTQFTTNSAQEVKADKVDKADKEEHKTDGLLNNNTSTQYGNTIMNEGLEVLQN